MAQIALGVVGGIIGGIVSSGNPAAISAGFAIGYGIGSVAFAPKTPTQNVVGPRLNDTRIMDADPGGAIAIPGGITRIAGTVMWAGPMVETEHTEEFEGGGKGGGGGGGGSSTTYTYSRSCAVLVCEGEIDGIGKIWADSKLLRDYRGAVAASGIQQCTTEQINTYRTLASAWLVANGYAGDPTTLSLYQLNVATLAQEELDPSSDPRPILNCGYNAGEYPGTAVVGGHDGGDPSAGTGNSTAGDDGGPGGEGEGEG